MRDAAKSGQRKGDIPHEILFAAELPKTRAGRSCAACCATSPMDALGDTTTLADPAVVAKLKEQYEEE